jgi:hypothetical protein
MNNSGVSYVWPMPSSKRRPTLSRALLARVMVFVRHLTLLVAILILAIPAHAEGAPNALVTPEVIPTLKCLRNVLKSSPHVKTVDLYVVDEQRLAIEFRFKSKAGTEIVEDFILRGTSRYGMTYYVMVPNDASDAAGRETMELVSAAGSKCSVAEVTDDSYPQRKPRDQWEHDNSLNTSLLPAADEVASGSPVPASVQKAAQWLAPIAHVAAFPKGAVPWPIADPGAPYNNSDIRTRGWL